MISNNNNSNKNSNNVRAHELLSARKVSCTPCVLDMYITEEVHGVHVHVEATMNSLGKVIGRDRFRALQQAQHFLHKRRPTTVTVIIGVRCPMPALWSCRHNLTEAFADGRMVVVFRGGHVVVVVVGGGGGVVVVVAVAVFGDA